jgi:ketosteroid isomerase-like protein
MSQEKVELVRAMYEAARRRDWDRVFRDQDLNVELTTPERGFNTGTYRGRAEIQKYWLELFSAFEAVSVEPEKLVEIDDQVVAVVRTRMRPKGSAAELETRNGHLWTFRESKAVSIRIFPDPEKALEAVGLSG